MDLVLQSGHLRLPFGRDFSVRKFCCFFQNSEVKSKAGHVRVYELQSGTWEQLGDDIDGEAELDRHGDNISLSANGKRLAIGSPRTFSNLILTSYCVFLRMSRFYH